MDDTERPPIDVRREGPLLIVTLDRPDRLNAFTHQGYHVLADALTAADEDDEVRCIVLEGAGRAFSSGVDLDALRGGNVADFRREFDRLLAALMAVRTPIVAGVHGVAVGFGATVLLHCDIIVVADDCRIRFPFTQLGTVPEAGSSWLLPAAIGRQRAADLLLTSRWLSGAEAVELGLAARSCPSAEVAAAARQTALDIAAHAPAAVRAAKQLLRASAIDQLHAALERETVGGTELSAVLGLI